MRFIDDLIEKLTHRHMLESQIAHLQKELDGVLDRLDDLGKSYDEQRTETLRSVNDVYIKIQQLQEDKEADNRLAAAEQERMELSRRIDDLDAKVRQLQEDKERDERLAIVERDRTELFHRIDDLNAQIQQLQQNAQRDERLDILEQDRTELFARVTALQKTVDEGSVYSIKEVRGDEELDSKVIPLNQYLKGSGIALSMHLTSTEKVLDESVYHTSDLTRTSTLAMIADEIRDKSVEGAVAELGVAQGDFAEVINAHFPDKKLFLFDTFEGFPESDVKYEQENGYSNPLSHWYTDISVQKVLERMRYPENCIVKKGYFPDTTEGLNERFCFVSIDCDLYKPIYSGLSFFYPRLVKGGYIFVHDYRSKCYKGVRKALKRYAEEQGISYCVLPDNTGTAIIIK